MFGLPLAFTAPAALVPLILLAALYVFLRITPPRPRQSVFPPLRLLLGIKREDQTPARTPWPLLALRLFIAAAAILAMAGPIWNPSLFGGGAGPVLMIVDDGWPAAPRWEARKTLIASRLEAAARDGRLTVLLPVSQGGVDIAPAEPARNSERLRALEPQPYAPDHRAILPPIRKFLGQFPNAEILWLADGLSLGETDSFAHDLAGLAKGHEANVLIDNATAIGLTSVENVTGSLQAKVLRAGATAPRKGSLRALDAKGLTIGEAPFDLDAADAATASFDLPIELRNQVSRIAIDGERSAGAVVLLDERWRKRRVAIASGVSADVAQPLLSPTYYLSRALGPFADLREWHDSASDPIVSLIDEKPSALMLADMSVANGPAHDALTKFVEDGGVLVRFAGSRLAASADDLTPTELRRGGRTLGGALSWETPKRLAPFDRDSPFFGLSVPDEVTVSRQVLAEPEPGLAAKTWARLADGTPLVTADRRGKGLIVLFHVTADTTWSNLPISGLFVDMLRRIVALAAQSAPEAQKDGAKDAVTTRPPKSILDGYGALGAPPASAQPIAADFAGPADAAHPPGFYGTGEALTAINTLASDATLKLADYAGLSVKADALTAPAALDLRVWLLTAAFLGLLIDAVASLWLGGAFFWRRAAGPAGAAMLALVFFLAPSPRPAFAADQPQISERDKEAALSTHLAYVVTGDAAVDDASRLGLLTLSRILSQRTSLSPGEPIGLDPAKDELAFYPLIYWPIVASRPQPPTAAVTRIAAYMKGGGTVLFDTRDALAARPGGPETPEAAWLRQLLAGVDVPELEPVPRDHVITKSFYLIDGFIGRTTVGQTWIEALPPPDPNDTQVRAARAGDSVSPLIITSNDLAAAWAADEDGQPLYPLFPNIPRQRELALRGGVNLVMYTLTGNYKADQVHARDILDRLSH
jgi:hypothetical protein